jgi:hypothetical protein
LKILFKFVFDALKAKHVYDKGFKKEVLFPVSPLWLPVLLSSWYCNADKL